MILTLLLTLAGTTVSLVDTDRGRRIEISKQVDAPAATVWNLHTRVEHWGAWGPAVSDVDYPDRVISADTDGLVQVFGLFWVPFRIETVEEHRWTWSVWGRTPPADDHRVDDLSADGASGGDPSGAGCRVALELPLWAPWYLPVCWLALHNMKRVAEWKTSGADEGCSE